MKNFDVDKVDVKDWSKVMNQRLQKWVADNPQYTDIIAKGLVQVTNEYKRLAGKP